MALTFDELVPGDFQPTSVDGGLPKLVRIWEYLRDLNTGGYGGAVLVDVKDAISKGHNGVTSCSPFTGTCIYMALDPRPFNAAQPWSLKEPYEPIFDGGKPLDVNFYRLHNGFSLSSYASVKDKKFAGWKADFKKRYVERIPQLAHDFSAFKFINHSAGSVIALNLGTRVDSKRMRRGDMVGIDWHNGNGHATFCWNVHLNEKGEVDCFQFISSNGTSANGGAGITIFRYPDVRPPPAGRERARVPISDGKTIAMRASAKKLTGPLGRQTYIFENHFCVVDLPVRGGSVEVLFVGAKFKDGTLATATTSVQTDNAPSSFDLLPWLLAQGVPLEVARPKAKPDEYGRF